MKRFCVFGNPIRHSRSPQIHQLFAQQYGHSLDYQRHLASPYGFNTAVAGEFRQGLAGANVTVPFKVAAWQLATRLSSDAMASGAVNTLIPQSDGGLLGANTDGLGLLHDLTRQGIELSGKRLLLLGAGGAARGVLKNLVDARPEVIWIANRTTSKAASLAARHDSVYAVNSWRDVSQPDVIINATSASLNGPLPEVPSAAFSSASVIYDMMYSQDLTPFLRQAKQCSDGILSDGLGMLVGQAAESYALWWQCKRPEMAAVITALRATLA